MGFANLERDVIDAARKVLAEAEANEPAIDSVVGDALTAIGAPPEVATALRLLLAAVLTHYKPEQAVK